MEWRAGLINDIIARREIREKPSPMNGYPGFSGITICGRLEGDVTEIPSFDDIKGVFWTFRFTIYISILAATNIY